MSEKNKNEQKKQGIEEGPPIWVESCLSPKEYKEAAKRYPNTFKKGDTAPAYDPSFYKGGRWRYRMGDGYSPEELVVMHKETEKLYALMRERYFAEQNA